MMSLIKALALLLMLAVTSLPGYAPAYAASGLCRGNEGSYFIFPNPLDKPVRIGPEIRTLTEADLFDLATGELTIAEWRSVKGLLMALSGYYAALGNTDRIKKLTPLIDELNSEQSAFAILRQDPRRYDLYLHRGDDPAGHRYHLWTATNDKQYLYEALRLFRKQNDVWLNLTTDPAYEDLRQTLLALEPEPLKRDKRLQKHPPRRLTSVSFEGKQQMMQNPTWRGGFIRILVLANALLDDVILTANEQNLLDRHYADIQSPSMPERMLARDVELAAKGQRSYGYSGDQDSYDRWQIYAMSRLYDESKRLMMAASRGEPYSIDQRFDFYEQINRLKKTCESPAFDTAVAIQRHYLALLQAEIASGREGCTTALEGARTFQNSLAAKQDTDFVIKGEVIPATNIMGLQKFKNALSRAELHCGGGR